MGLLSTSMGFNFFTFIQWEISPHTCTPTLQTLNLYMTSILLAIWTFCVVEATTVPSLFYGKPYTCPKSFSLADFNYPAITIPQLDPGHSLNVTRTVTNVGSPRTYRVHIKAPPQVVVTVEPRKLRFKKKGERKELRVTLTLKPQTKNTTDYVFGWLTWTDHKHHVRSPIAVKIAH